jgi:hypothetical protein
MKTRAALVLSVAGILLTGAAALAVNTYTLNSTHTSTLGNASSILLPDGSPTAPPAQVLTPAAPVASPQEPPAATSQPSPSPVPGSDDGGTGVTQPGAGSGGTVVSEPGDDRGGLRGGGGHGSDD